MILIVTEPYDKSTHEVMKWLKKLNFADEVHRINQFENVKKLEISIQDKMLKLETEQQKLNSKDVKVVWFRRGTLPLLDNMVVQEYHHKEYIILKNYFYYFFENKKHIGTLWDEEQHNKLIDLDKAKQAGFYIPRSYIVTNIDMVKRLNLKLPTEFINKALGNVYDLKNHIGGVTKEVNVEELETSVNDFFPSLLQEKIEKDFEIRVFYLCGKIYSMAIFSQLDHQTQLNYKKYNQARSNRMIPFKLPDSEEEKVHHFMKKCNLNTGSIDLIYGKNEKFYFLEVNRVGQFDWVSVLCNYNIERDIAQQLIKHHETTT